MCHLNHAEVKLVETAPKNIISVRQKMNMNDFDKYMGKLFGIIAKEGLTPIAPPMAIYHDVEFNPLNSDLEIAIPVKETIGGTKMLEGGLCAMGTLKGPYSEIPSMYAKIHQWMKKEGYEPANPPYEIYISDPAETGPEDILTEVYFPVKK